MNSEGFLQDLKWPAFNLFGMYVLQSGFTFLYILLLSQIGEQLAAKIRQDLFKQIVIQDMTFFDENRTGELVNRYEFFIIFGSFSIRILSLLLDLQLTYRTLSRALNNVYRRVFVA